MGGLIGEVYMAGMEGRVCTFVFGFEGHDDALPDFCCFAAEDNGNRGRHDVIFWSVCSRVCSRELVGCRNYVYSINDVGEGILLPR